jgi:hypothetical protein
MGTNYYLHEHTCAWCGRSDEIHIGKSSGGWCFALHIYEAIPDLAAWQLRWGQREAQIRAQGEEVVLTPEQMLAIITKRSWPERPKPGHPYTNWAHFHLRNHSETGPNGLVRHKIDGEHCIGHGEGTWDLMIGEFS